MMAVLILKLPLSILNIDTKILFYFYTYDVASTVLCSYVSCVEKVISLEFISNYLLMFSVKLYFLLTDLL